MNKALPNGWAVARISELAEVRLGKMLSPKAQQPGLKRRRYLRNENVRWGTIDFSDLKEMGFKAEEIDRYAIRPGDLVVCEGGEPGRCAIYRGEFAPLMYQKALHRIRPESEVSASLLRYWLEYLSRSGKLTPKIAQTTIQHLPLERFESLEIPLPARREQEAIVLEIERLLTRIDSGGNELERVRGHLTRYRASVLKAACEGRLVPTEAELSRAEGREYEDAQSMLQRVLVSEDANVVGRRKKTNSASQPLDLSGLREGWTRSTLNRISEIKGGLTKGQKRRAGEKLRSVPYLRVANVQRGWIDLSEIKEIEATDDEIRDLALIPGDVLFNEGGDRDKLGRGWVWQGQLPVCIHQNHVFRARILGEVIDPKLLSWYGNTFGQQYFISEGKQTTNLASINLTKLGALSVPIPPKAEQTRIVAEAERRLSIADEIATTIDAALARAARLRQAILKRAFEGRLVPQDPNDEAATVLLERIRKEREAVASEISNKPKRRRTRVRARKARV